MTLPITVVVMTYNQVKYIEKCLDSILSQIINVDYKIIIHDDCSDDGTYEAILNKQKANPNKIEIIRQDSRKFLKDGFNMMIYKYVVPHVNSEYVAYCDGDDYWCDNSKLQKQYNYMKKHQNYSMSFHNAYQLKNNGDMSSKWYIDKEGDVDMSFIINDKPGIHIATSSIFLKTETFKDFSEWRKAFPVEDIPMYMTAAIYGKIHRFEDIMCVYRQFAQGSWSSQNQVDRNRIVENMNRHIDAIKIFDEQTNYNYSTLVSNHIDICMFRIASEQRDFKEMFSKKYRRFIKRMSIKERLSLFVQYKMPKLYKSFRRNQSSIN